MENNNMRTFLLLLKALIMSGIGIFAFFIQFKYNGSQSILIDHLVSLIRNLFGENIKFYTLFMVVLGGVFPFIDKTWNKSTTSMVLSFLKLLGIIFASMFVFDFMPSALAKPNMLPFLYNKLAISLSLLIPIGSIFLSCIVSFGLLEFIGKLVNPFMRFIWKTPGESAIDAVASFVGSYSLALLITDKVYQEGKYSIKEATIIATGFSTVSATFMVIVSKTLGLMEHWGVFFWVTLLVTFLTTAICARIYPISRMNNSKKLSSDSFSGNIFEQAWQAAIKQSDSSGSIVHNLVSTLKSGCYMAVGVTCSVLSIGMIGLLLAEYTKLFDAIGLLFYPIFWVMQFNEPILLGKAIASGLAEMFLPSLIMKTEADLSIRFIIGVVSISSILFFSASIPCIISTGIPISIKNILIIWFERTVVSLIIVIPISYLLF